MDINKMIQNTTIPWRAIWKSYDNFCSCTFSNFSISAEEKSPHTTEAYSDIGFTNVRQNFNNLILHKLNLRFFFCILVIYYIIDVHRPSENVRPRCL